MYTHVHIICLVMLGLQHSKSVLFHSIPADSGHSCRNPWDTVKYRCLPPLPPPSHPNVSWKWSFSRFSTACHHHHLPHIQTWAGVGVFLSILPTRHHHHLPWVQTQPGGGVFQLSDMFPNTTTSLAFKCKLEVVSFIFFDCIPPLPPPPPPSHPNARRMWCLSAFGHNYPHHLPQGCPFRRFRRNAASGEIWRGMVGRDMRQEGQGSVPEPSLMTLSHLVRGGIHITHAALSDFRSQ